MKEGQTDFLDDFDTDTAEAAPVERATDPTGEQPRGPDGKFAAKVEAAAKGEKPSNADTFTKKVDEFVEQGAAPPAAQEEDQHVPLSVVIALRKELQALKAGKKAEQPANSNTQSNQPPPKSPEFAPPQVDWEQDPQFYVQAQIHSIKMEQSKFFAVQQSSEQEVAEAWSAFDAACNTDPALSAYSETLVNHPHPMGEVLKWHRKQQQLAQLEEAGGLDKYRERIIAEYLASQQGQQPAMGTAQPARQTQPKPAVPPSLANGGIGAAAASEPTSDDLDLDGFFAEARKPRKR